MDYAHQRWTGKYAEHPMKTLLCLAALAIYPLAHGAAAESGKTTNTNTVPSEWWQTAKVHPPEATWLTNHYGKTLSSIGDIASIKIRRTLEIKYVSTDLTLTGLITTATSAGKVATNESGSRTESRTLTVKGSWTHADLWNIIEKARIHYYFSGNEQLFVPPYFTIEYTNGVQVNGDRHTASIKLPTGEVGMVRLSRPK
jgi:hypothetical protein